ncbi:NADH-quinone oxidoreductase subunit H [uncultured Salinisphaera sp.]|uniref:complex I subunit 1 family protein n=1 Tax=uncultured Salinisphaera sp. TaxID=359372 RepID=UPI0032B1541A|tara:strand:+ start:1289 stop:2203 length:915 start_codon:yes stop_codon:yes gene_type:complete
MTPIVLTVAWVAFLLGMAWYIAVLDGLWSAAREGRPPRAPLANPLYRCATMLRQQSNLTEAPDLLNWRLAPALYAGLAGTGVALVPFSGASVLADLEVGIVWWGAVEALTVVIVFLHGWSANSQFGLIGAYRYVAIGLPAMLISMFVLIAAALPAESLAVPKIIESQRELWNVIRQPLGLPLFLLIGLSLSFRGPFNYADSADLADGTASEISGAARLVWEFARLAMLTAVATVAASVFLGGYLGPWLPGPMWLVLKTAAVLLVLVGLSHQLARISPSRMMTLIWTVLLPLSFVHLVWAGVLAL